LHRYTIAYVWWRCFAPSRFVPIDAAMILEISSLRGATFNKIGHLGRWCR
jgi:hypothetical protein